MHFLTLFVYAFERSGGRQGGQLLKTDMINPLLPTTFSLSTHSYTVVF